MISPHLRDHFNLICRDEGRSTAWLGASPLDQRGHDQGPYCPDEGWNDHYDRSQPVRPVGNSPGSTCARPRGYRVDGRSREACVEGWWRAHDLKPRECSRIARRYRYSTSGAHLPRWDPWSAGRRGLLPSASPTLRWNPSLPLTCRDGRGSPYARRTSGSAAIRSSAHAEIRMSHSQAQAR
jgi:hypothetical protein